MKSTSRHLSVHLHRGTFKSSISLNIRYLSDIKDANSRRQTHDHLEVQSVQQKVSLEKLGTALNSPKNAFNSIREETLIPYEYPLPELTLPPVKQELIAKIPVEYHGVTAVNFNNETCWVPIFRLPRVTKFRAVIKFKLYLTGLSAIVFAHQSSQLLTAQNGSEVLMKLMLPAISLTGLIFIGNYFRRLVCQIYCTTDLEYVRICRFSFFGNRRDIVIPVECVIPLTETNASNRAPVFDLKFRLPEKIDLKHDEYEFYDQGLKVPLKLGGVIDKEKFSKIIGNVLVNRVFG